MKNISHTQAQKILNRGRHTTIDNRDGRRPGLPPLLLLVHAHSGRITGWISLQRGQTIRSLYAPEPLPWNDGKKSVAKTKGPKRRAKKERLVEKAMQSDDRAATKIPFVHRSKYQPRPTTKKSERGVR